MSVPLIAARRMTGTVMLRKAHAFTLVELLVVIGILALLISVLLPAMNRARRNAVDVRTQSNLRQLTAAYLDYAHANRGALLPGLLPKLSPFGRDWEIFDKPSRTLIVGKAAQQWPCRLIAHTQTPLWPIVRPGLSSIDIARDPYSASLYPVFGLNTVFLGGHAVADVANVGTARDYYRGYLADNRPNIGKHVAFRLNEVRTPARQIVFTEVTLWNGSSVLDEGDPTQVKGFHYVIPPRADLASGVYWDVVNGKANVRIDPSTKRVLGVPEGRSGNGRVPVSFLDGHVESRKPADLQDMREWAPRATGSDYQF